MAYVSNDKEVNSMPKRDGTGPMGAGEMTGRGFGPCAGAPGMEYSGGRGRGRGRGLCPGFNRRRGFGRGLGFGRGYSGDQKDLLQEQKSFLQDRLAEIDRQLEDL
jgi:hypothetical protein